MVTDYENIKSVEFLNFRAFNHFSIKLQHMNILVGPNNSGKSTIIYAFKVLDIALRQANSKKASIVKGPSGECYGYIIPGEMVPFPLEFVHTDYEDIDSSVIFKVSNGNKLILYFPQNGGCILLTENIDGKIINTPTLFKKYYPISIQIVPVLGPVEQDEQILSEETVRKGLSTHLASRHFRNFWWYFPHGFELFAELLKSTWPGMEIERPYKVDALSKTLIMNCMENRIPRELYIAGFGFQIWCQLLTHISRCNKISLFIVDEPEIYLHPDIQRHLIGILRDAGPDILLATHATEIMGEADASEIVLIDKKKRSGERLHDIEGVQEAMALIGSAQNITLSQLARTKRLLFVEGFYDYKLIRKFAKRLGFHELAAGLDITPAESGGFSSWEKIKSLAWGLEKTLSSKFNLGAIYDRDFWPDEEVSNIISSLEKDLKLVHIHRRKEIENYLLIPCALERIINKSIMERAKHTSQPYQEIEPINTLLDRITTPDKLDIQAQYIAKRIKYFNHSSLDKATITSEALTLFEDKWNNIESRMEIVPGKSVLCKLRSELQARHSINLTDFKIISELKTEEIPKDLIELLNKIDSFRQITN